MKSGAPARHRNGITKDNPRIRAKKYRGLNPLIGRKLIWPSSNAASAKFWIRFIIFVVGVKGLFFHQTELCNSSSGNFARPTVFLYQVPPLLTLAEPCASRVRHFYLELPACSSFPPG